MSNFVGLLAGDSASCMKMFSLCWTCWYTLLRQSNAGYTAWVLDCSLALPLC